VIAAFVLTRFGYAPCQQRISEELMDTARRLLAALLIALLTLGTTACGDDGDTGQGTDSGAEDSGDQGDEDNGY
jgi:hypothetical protein